MFVYKVGFETELSCAWSEIFSCNPEASGAKLENTESRSFGMSNFQASVTKQPGLYGQAQN
ncbi:hypothetical protein DDZ16_00860 [Marinilabilia rubra]|uniref:Uncharacterized protein n=1 Tax=Marinilabilia rubra TaxID=2162893 RepID=A0A2U2BDD5_9BACT|nr:hypothetical protein DDZ16_00860 [Marinilabilia rubra]